MKAFVLAETTDAQRALCAGARSIADEVVLAVVKGAPLTGVADKAYDVELPAGEPVENAAAGVQAAYDAAQPDVVLVEPTPRNKILAGLLAAKLGTAVISDVAAIDGDTVSNMYFGGLASTKQKATGVKVYTVAATCFADAEATGSDELRPSLTPLLRSLSYFVEPRKYLVRALTSPSATLLLVLVVALVLKKTSRWLAIFALRLAASLVALVLSLRTLTGCLATSTSAFLVSSLLLRHISLWVSPARCSTW